MNKLRCVSILLVALTFGIMGGNSANAAYQYTYKIVVIDKCEDGQAQMYYDAGTNWGYVEGQAAYWPQNSNCRDGTTSYHTFCQDVSRICGQNASMDYTSRCEHGNQGNVFKMAFNSSVSSTNFTDCGKWHLYSHEGDDFGEYVVCWANENYSDVTGRCTDFNGGQDSDYDSADAAACDDSYIGSLPTINKVYIGSTTAPSLTAKAQSPIFTVIENPQHACCTSGSCDGYTDWTTSNTKCQTRTKKSCNAAGTCGTGSGSGQYARCREGYYATQNNTNGYWTDSNITYACSDTRGLRCTACPSADSGWEGVSSEPGSSEIEACYEYKTKDVANCNSGKVMRYYQHGEYDINIQLYDPEILPDQNQYWNAHDAVCTSCPSATSSYSNSALTTLIPGLSVFGTRPLNQCYVGGGSSNIYHDRTGAFILANDCYYDATATSNLL